ncbi:hypothetical protein HKT18_07930 [Flavobacterium sp. IMCC34852]|uniref:Uncharacterized protein n=1 Tax=Flavobacterium rivulicola TaxID=2732161 RepID=A0A7Y3VYX5_9FLAO|nr:hypothetical protein [Flavobacterium sp. IMCC34852]NNT72138.1 hypothetical protein [Flavobacterium sp. IMCC34852]
MLKEKILYVDEIVLKRIESNFELIEKSGWYKLYQNKVDKSFWRLDEPEKYDLQMFVKLESVENWTDYNDQDLRIELLKEHRGLSSEKCKWKDCSKKALNNLVFCEFHAYKEMGIRR